jgi:hypothetical protein
VMGDNVELEGKAVADSYELDRDTGLANSDRLMRCSRCALSA